jgi:LemA protein
VERVIWVVIVVVAIIVLLLLVLVGMFNKLVRLRNRAENAWAQVDVQLRKRYDLIPNLVETVKGYAAHERETFEAVTAARAAAQQAEGVAEQAQAENVLTAALGRLFAVAEAYPQLRATENFQQLQAQLADVEQNIAVARQVYNDTVLSYDNALETVPTNIIASMFHFNAREYFQTEDVTRAAPQVSFGDGGPPAPPAAAPPPPETPAPTPPAQSS